MINDQPDNFFSNYRKFLVESIHSGKRLDVYLSEMLQEISRSQIQKLVAAGQVTINGSIASKKETVTVEDAVEISLKGFIRPGEVPTAQDMALDVLYEDEWLIAINKPAGLIVHPGSGVRDGTLVNALAFHCAQLSDGFTTERPGIVHRLDKDTTGVIIAAKSNTVHDQLASAFMNRKVKKVYIGYCVGKTGREHGFIDLPLERSRRDPVKRAISVTGKQSRTEFHIIAQKAGILAVKFLLHTGRTHQIRVHCSAMGFPIVADTLYGGGKERVLKIEPMDRPFAYSVFKCFERQALHAYSLSLRHPVTGEELSITAPMPADFLTASLRFGDNSLFKQSVQWNPSE
ncbi:MAG TPA: RluA family pseudouridine synthase [Chitinispirillaceae bacterium]|nr:RluA family pseudouridine synthase [Chitinispirillaceae bacterium]